MKGYVYILRSLRNKRFYIGSTNNVVHRLRKHNLGLVKSTRNFRPYKIELSQKYDSITQAKQIEYKIKKLKRKDYIEKIVEDGYIKSGR